MRNNWKYTIKIKHLFEDDTTPVLVSTLCESLCKQLSDIKDKVKDSDIAEDDKNTVLDTIEAVEDNFEFLNNLATESIPKTEWDDYNFYGDFEEEFNGYLTELYDLGDMRVELESGDTEKFIFIA